MNDQFNDAGAGWACVASTIIVMWGRMIIMKYWSTIAFALVLAGVAAISQSPTAFGQADAGWKTLFDGKSFDNFNQIRPT